MFLPDLPMTTPSSASQSICSETWASNGISANGPLTLVVALVKKTGRSGNFISLYFRSDHSQFGLPVHLFRDVGIKRNIGERAVDARRGLGEEDGALRQFHLFVFPI